MLVACAYRPRIRNSICYDGFVLTHKPLRAVLFDWDGTLLDSFKADTNAYLQMFHVLGVSWDPATLPQHYSPDWHNVYRAAKLPPESWAEADRLWRHFYAAERPLLQTGVREVVQKLAARLARSLADSRIGRGATVCRNCVWGPCAAAQTASAATSACDSPARLRTGLLRIRWRRARGCENGSKGRRLRSRRHRALSRSGETARLATKCSDQGDYRAASAFL